MRIDLHTSLPSGAARNKTSFDSLLSRGAAIEVSQKGGDYFPPGRVAIEAALYERYVAWSSSSMRESGVYLEEHQRLQDLLQAASSVAGHSTPAGFFVRAVDSIGPDFIPRRYSMLLERFNESSSSNWLIRQ